MNASDPHQPQDPLVGSTLADRYVVDRLVGTGGMGSVYAAHQIGLDRSVAIKILRHDIAQTGTEVERFRREALATALLRHPHIVTVYDFGTMPNGCAFLVMELLSGPSLAAWLQANPYPDPARVVEVLKPVCSALDAMHKAGIIHRDIKPANIALPDPAHPDDVVKVLDLGIVRFADGVEGDLTGRLIIGTAEYIAPEVATGGKAGAASDLYALAVTTYEALTGWMPFSGASGREILIKHVTESPRPPSEVRTTLPATLDDVLLRALAKEPGDRYDSAKQFAAALEDALERGARPARAAARARPARRSVLVVESDPETAAFATQCLEAFGYEVTAVNDGFDAILRLGGQAYDLVVVNATLPGLDGLSFLRLKTQKGIETPALLVAPEGIPLGEGETAADAVLRLPLTVESLLDRVTAAIDKRGRE